MSRLWLLALNKQTRMAIKHTHQFFVIGNVERFDKTSPSSRLINAGVEVVCALCGEVRRAWRDGEIEIIYDGKTDTK